MGLFGLGKSAPSEPQSFGEAVNAAPEEPASKGNSGYTFDPTGLERAAKAVRELDASTNADKAFKLVKEQERTIQMRLQAGMAQNEASAEENRSKRLDKEAEYRRREMQTKFEQDKKLIDIKNQKHKENLIADQAARRKLQEEQLRKQEQSLQKQEEMRRQTLQYEAELRKQTEVAKVEAEAQGKIRQERMNHTLHLEKARVEAGEFRRTVTDSIALAGSTIGSGIMMFLGDRDRLAAAAGTLSLVALGVYGAKTATGVAGRFVEARLGKPSLIRDTSRRFWKAPWATKQERDVLHGVFLKDKTRQRLSDLAVSVANTRQNKAPFRNVLLHGPPGNGKTMYAKALAKHSGLDYAIMTGGDVAPLGKEAVTELHKIFDWAEKSPGKKGVLLFIDEADAFLRKRSEEHMTADMRNALNAFLYRTGEASDKFMLVLSSNQPDQFDWAVNDRLDELVHLGLPGRKERMQMLQHYFSKYLLLDSPDSNPETAKIKLDERIQPAVLEKVADKTSGFSGREMSKLVIAWQAAAYAHADSLLTLEKLEDVLSAHLTAHKSRARWGKQQQEMEADEYSADE